MAQSGYTPILIYASGTAAAVPSAANLTSSANGVELALNYADGKLYFKNSSGVVTLLASSATAGGTSPGGSTTQVQYNNAGAFAGSANFVWDNSNVRLGIGTSSPAVPLDVVAQTSASIARFRGRSSDNIATLEWYDNTNATRYTYISSGPSSSSFWNQANTPMAFGTNDTERMRIDSSGNVGIGTSSPSSFGGKLVVYKTPGTAYTDSSIAMTDGSNVTLYIGNTSTTASSIWTSDLLSFGTGADAFTERMRISSAGNVGIGTSSPSYKLDVSGASASGIARFINSWSDGANPAIIVDGTGGDGRLLELKSGGTRSWPLFRVNANSTDVLLVNGDSTIKTAGTISVGGATPSTSGAGITFPATQSASSNANTLDDYEEGTWTTSFTNYNCSSTTLSDATYTKVGRLVTLIGKFSSTLTTTATDTQIVFTLPFGQRVNLMPAVGSALHNLAATYAGITVVADSSGASNTSAGVSFPAAQVTKANGSSFTVEFTYVYEA